ncbi:MAG: hypothetical protein H0V29_12925 [Thermoleophilaceae bacterium]|nr:hypothetical protein [Thermoleophilaceae bacterium]
MFNVDTTADAPSDPADNSCSVASLAGACTLREAVTEARAGSGDEIVLGPGRHQLNSELDSLSQDMTIRGAGANSTTVIRQPAIPGDQYRVFDVSSAKVVSISGLTVTGGDVTGDGGGIRNSGNLTLNRVVVGGNNSSGGGGGVFTISGATLEVTDSNVNDNNAGRGAGIYAAGAVSLTRSLVDQNDASVEGGGLYQNPTIGTAPVSVLNSTVANNTSAAAGAAVMATTTGVQIDFSTIAYNDAGGSNGSITPDNVVLNVFDSIVVSQKTRGRKVRSSCRKATRNLRSKRSCTRLGARARSRAAAAAARTPSPSPGSSAVGRYGRAPTRRSSPPATPPATARRP